MITIKKPKNTLAAGSSDWFNTDYSFISQRLTFYLNCEEKDELVVNCCAGSVLFLSFEKKSRLANYTIVESKQIGRLKIPS